MADYRDISTLHNWGHNPRSMTKDGLARLIKQIKKLGVYKPLLITEDGTVLGGNMRLQALRELGQKQVWVSVVKADTEEKKIEYALSDNDRAGKYEADQLANLIGNFPDVEWNDFTVDIDEPLLVQDMIDNNGFNPTNEWKNMPEFTEIDNTAFKSIIVHFTNEIDLEKFADLVNQKITMKTRSLWFPANKINEQQS